MRYANTAAAFVLAIVAAGCTVDVAGAPCATDDNCPSGQFCGGGGKCELGQGQGRDAGGARDAGGRTDASAGGDSGGTEDAGADTGLDAAVDAGLDTGHDGGSDAGVDVGTDAGADAGTVCHSRDDCGGALCCSGVCADPVRGCCAESDCTQSKAGLLCKELLCQCGADLDCDGDERICDTKQQVPTCVDGCSADKPCDQGLCCRRKCVTGECCENFECKDPAKPTCGALHHCNDLCGGATDGNCGPGYICLSGICVPGECASAADCTARYPDRPSCDPSSHTCVNACTGGGPGNCGKGYVCCNGGACVPGACCIDDDCKNSPATPFCVANQCVAKCSVEANCPGGHCCTAGPSSGSCYTGDCCDSTQCGGNSSGPKCISHACGCYADLDCGTSGSGKICFGNVCVTGTCHTSTECTGASAPVCDASNHSCRHCQSGTECTNAGKGQVCCGGECYSGACCKDSDCTSPTRPICQSSDHTCRPCAIDNICKTHGLGDYCCGSGPLGGSCYTGTCCRAGQCTDPLKPVCLNSQCSPCAPSPDTCADQYGGSYQCCTVGLRKGACYNGSCCDDSQCPDPNVKFCDPTTSSCVQCLDSTSCLAGQVCCNGRCSWGSCCADADCKLPPVMDGGTSTADAGNPAYGMCYQNHCEVPCSVGCPPGTNCCQTLGFCVQLGATCCRLDSECTLSTCCYGICTMNNPDCKF